MLFSSLISNIEYKITGRSGDGEISLICRDSRLASPSSVFICIKGATVDGHDFAMSAYSRGARFFIAEKELELPKDATVAVTSNTRIALAVISAEFYKHPDRSLNIIGITGTKGKTTTALTAYEILNSAGIPTGYIGSNGVRFGLYRYQTANTTPESCDLFKYMRLMVDAGITCLIMEVSSQAIFMNRVHGIDFDTCVFTNLYHDHIGGVEHPTFEHYRDSKRRLFAEFSPKNIIFNADDAYAKYMISEAVCNKISYSCTDKLCDFYAFDIVSPSDSKNPLSVSFAIKNGSEKATTSISMPGRFSVYNALAATAICRMLGVELHKIARILHTVSVEGRFETVSIMPNVSFVIDYAHNEESLRSALLALREHRPSRLICLFGSVGGRTFERRRELGEVASRLADFCIITSDNPNYEPPEKIIDEIAAHFKSPECCPYIKISDRREAIRYAVKNAKPGDIILLAGKGHEDYQLINEKKIPFSERAIILEAVDEMLEAIK